jgi:cyanophycin synthetase
MTSTDGVVIDERLVAARTPRARSAKMVLQNPRVDFAVFEVARGGNLCEGLGHERNDVGVVLNAPGDIWAAWRDTPQPADVKAVIVRLGATASRYSMSDPLVRAMRRRCSGRIIWPHGRAWQRHPRSVDDHCRRWSRCRPGAAILAT